MYEFKLVKNFSYELIIKSIISFKFSFLFVSNKIGTNQNLSTRAFVWYHFCQNQINIAANIVHFHRWYSHSLCQRGIKSIDILGISMPINVNNIKKAYKKLVKIFLPDVNKDSKKAEKRFKEINEAYKILLKKFLKTHILQH